MFVIHKIELQAGLHEYQLPFGAQLLHVAMQRGTPTLWYKRLTMAPTVETRILLFIGTGQELGGEPQDASWKHIGTMLSDGQALVFHVFELVSGVGG